MLWNKSWLETRWRFLIGLALLTCSAAASVFSWPQVVKIMPLASSLNMGGEIGRRIREAVEVAQTYRGYVWSQWFRQNLPQMWTIFAVLLGTGGLLSQTSGGAALYTLSMPVSRARLLGIRAATGLAELLVLALVPSLLLPLLSPAVGQTYGVGDVLVHGACLFVAGSVFFSLAFLLSTLFTDVWRPLLIALGLAIVLASCEQVFGDRWSYGILHAMSAESWFRNGEVQWPGLLASLVVSAAMLYGATVNIARRDF